VVRVPVEAGNYSSHHRVQTGTRNHLASYPICARGFSLEVKRPGREADDSPPSSAELTNVWSYISTLPLCLHGVVFS
jgi:hypothetical protein